MSIRAFTDQTVPRELLTEIIEIARWSPSYKNTQPWDVLVLSGEKKRRPVQHAAKPAGTGNTGST